MPFDQISAALKEVLQNSLPGKGLLWVDDAHLLDTIFSYAFIETHRNNTCSYCLPDRRYPVRSFD